MFRERTIWDDSDVITHKLENMSIDWIELWPFSFEKGDVNGSRLNCELNMLTTRFKISDEVNIKVGELVCEVVFDSIRDRAKE